MAGLGHNNGPTMERGFAFRKHAWTKARAQLMPKLPLAVIRRRVARAKALGLPYQTYATVHAASGRDIIAVMFSTNALRMMRDSDPLPDDRREKLVGLVECRQHHVVQKGLTLDGVTRVLEHNGIGPDTIVGAPVFGATYATMRQAMLEGCAGLPSDGVVLIGDTAEERSWSAAGKLAGFLSSDAYFTQSAL
jgi:hypothetical protein